MKKLTALWAILFLVVLGNTTVAQQKEGYPFESEIKAFKKADSLQMPPQHGILFIGSSSFRLWDDLEQRFPGKPIIKRGVGGCELADFPNHYMEAIVFPYEADKIFVYGGDNDIANGKSALDVARSFEKLWNQIQQRQPGTKVFFLSIKLSNSREKWFGEVRKANALIEKFLGKQKNGTYLDVASVLMGADGKPDDALFKSDRLHLNSEGYDRWQQVLAPYINEPVK